MQGCFTVDTGHDEVGEIFDEAILDKVFMQAKNNRMVPEGRVIMEVYKYILQHNTGLR